MQHDILSLRRRARWWVLVSLLFIASGHAYAKDPTETAQEEPDWGNDDNDWGDSEPAKPEPAAEGDDWGNDGDDWGDGEPAEAAAEPEDNDFDDGFDDDFGELEEIGEDIDKPLPVSLTGTLRSDWGLWTERFDENFFAKGRQNLDLEFSGRFDFFQFKAQLHGEYDFAYLNDRSAWDEPTLDAYEWQALTRDLFVAFSLGPVELTLGRQIVAWGEGDALSPLDVPNARDLREPGLADLDDIRMAALATRVGLFLGDHRLEAMVFHEAEFGLRSPPFGPFGAFGEVIASDPRAATLLGGKSFDWAHKQDRFSAEAQQPLGRWIYKGPGVDLGLYGAWILDKQGVILFPDFANDPAALSGFITASHVDLEIDHRPYAVTGTSGAWSVDSWLFKWELGAQINRSFNIGDTAAAVPDVRVTEGTLFDAMLGVTYNGITDLVLGLEFSKSTFLERPDELLFPVDEPMFAFRATWQALSERLKLLFVVSTIGVTADIDVLLRGEVSYNVFDTIVLALGYVSYLPGEDLGFISGFEEHDRLFFKARWDFTLL